MPRTEWNWNSANMFFLTRDGDIEIHHTDDEWEYGLFHYANQWADGGHRVKELDRFGRNQTDKMFIHLCACLHGYVVCTDSVTFKALSCKKVGDQYIVRLELADETLEMELSEMVAELETRCKA